MSSLKKSTGQETMCQQWPNTWCANRMNPLSFFFVCVSAAKHSRFGHESLFNVAHDGNAQIAAQRSRNNGRLWKKSKNKAQINYNMSCILCVGWLFVFARYSVSRLNVSIDFDGNFQRITNVQVVAGHFSLGLSLLLFFYSCPSKVYCCSIFISLSFGVLLPAIWL